ncbi:hypothetical protein NQ317_012657 [Molorchus minor]|uniref:DUF5641 domain-containing protein n=1 Tax=Molorchus minor TaxID=1323400 RepID=A0ABQ9J474_9CUCU|nr:hypothetical protein NQ317_012657 [Molorchus minor]
MTSTVERKERQLRILTSKKETLFTRLQNLYDESKKARFRIRYKTLEQTKRDFERVVDDINEVSLDIDADFVPNFNALERFDELYCHIQVVAETVLVRNTTNQTRNSIDENTSKKPIPRLPKLELPSFSGDLKEWPVFYECFKNLIHDNKELTAVDKIHYLIGKLSDSALCVCAGIPPIGDNYDVIWAALVEKYQDKRQLASAYLESIIGFKPMQTESLSNLNLFIEKFDTSVAALKKVGIDDLFDFSLSYIALSKLDLETKDCFEMFRADKTQIPSYIEIINFIKSRAKVLNASGKPQFSSSKAVSSHSSKSKGPITRSFVVNKTDSDKRCIVCNHVDHVTNRCPRFLKFSPKERYEFARGHRLCLNCLSTHRVIDCKSKVNCSSCHRRHHSLLHFENSAVNSGIDVTDSRNDSTSSTTVNATTSSSIEPTHSLCSTARSDFSRCGTTVLLSTLFESGGFNLVKWASNSERLLSNIPADIRLSHVKQFDTEYLKILGLQWHPQLDVLSFQVKVTEDFCTKRMILSTIAKIFDPLGILAAPLWPIESISEHDIVELEQRVVTLVSLDDDDNFYNVLILSRSSWIKMLNVVVYILRFCRILPVQQWKFNPPSAPHFGGIWESNVKCVKRHLYKAIGSKVLSYEEFNTLLVQIEALLNSRPLSALSSDPSEPLALTPSHFLNLTPLQNLPAVDLTNEPLNRLDRYQLIDRMVQDYWRRWHLEYLTTLQVRERWNTQSNPIRAGTVVVIKQDGTPPFTWPLGIIEDTFPGKDGIVRVVSVRTKQGSFKRPVVKIENVRIKVDIPLVILIVKIYQDW